MGTIIKQSIQGTIATYLGVAIGFVTNFFIVTKYLSTDQVSLLTNLLVNTAIMFASLSQLGLFNSTVRFFSYFKNPNNRNNGIFFWTIFIPLLGFIFFAFLFIQLQPLIVSVFGKNAPLFAEHIKSVLPLAFFILYLGIFEVNANVLMKVVFPRFVREVVIRTVMLIFYILFAFDYITFDGLIYGQCIAYAIATLLNFFYLLSLKQIAFLPNLDFLKRNTHIFKPFFLYSLFLIITSLTTCFSPTIVNYFISAQIGEDLNGIYIITVLIVALVSMPNRSLNAIVIPQIAADIKNNHWEKISTLVTQCVLNLLIISCFILLAIWINIDLIYHILPNGETFGQAKNIVLILGATQILISALTVVYWVLAYSKYYVLSFVYSFILTVAIILFSNALVKRYDLFGAAWTNLLSYIIYYSLTLLTLKTVKKLSFFTPAMLKTILLFVAIIVLNREFNRFIPIDNIWLNALARSVLFLGTYAFVVYKGDFSQDINRTANKFIEKIKVK